MRRNIPIWWIPIRRTRHSTRSSWCNWYRHKWQIWVGRISENLMMTLWG